MPINTPRRRISIRDMEAFLAVARTLSFSKASEMLNVSQPTLSATIRNIEQAMGARLFDRHTRSVDLTPVGGEFLNIAHRLLADFDDAFQHLENFIQGKEGILTIAASPSAIASFLPAALRRFREDHPRVDIQLYEEVYEDGIASLRAHKVDVALVPRKDTALDLVQHELFEDRLVVACPKDHPLARLESVSWAQVARYDQVALRPASNARQLVDQEYARQGVAIRFIYEVDRVSSMVSFIGEGMGIGILPRSLFQAYDRSSITSRPISDGQLSRVICASHLKNVSPSPSAEAFIALCRELGKEKAPPGPGGALPESVPARG